MHALHRILVNLNDCSSIGKDREEIIYDVRLYAENQTYDSEYDWRETQTAGRWSDIYPENVIFASDDIDLFLLELEKAVEGQNSYLEHNIEKIYEEYGNITLKDVFEIYKSTEKYCENAMLFYRLYEIAKIMNCSYTYESGFYDTEAYTSRITDFTIEKIKEHPEDYALVMFDYHI